jgi:eukaryotic-like serine/threonine-protein kinase
MEGSVNAPCLDENVVAALMAGTLGAAERAGVLAHLDGCDGCHGLLAALAGAYAGGPGGWGAVTVAWAEGEAGGAGGDGPLDRGSLVDRYVLLDVIGVGGMGVVYAAYDPGLERTVALKLLRPAAAPPGATVRAAARLRDEAKAMARLNSPYVVAVYDACAVNGRLCLAMELVRGATLRAWLAAGPRPWRDVVRVFVQAGRGLAAAHEAGVVHRDFKPENVLVTPAGHAKVADFGLASGAHEPAPDAGGTPGYMAPEQLRGEPLDGRSDQFSFCVAFYEALYGERPGDGAAPGPAGGRKGPARGARVPRWLRPVVLRGLHPEPGRRYPSMGALLDAIERRMRPPAGPLLALGGALLLGLGAALGYGQRAGAPAGGCDGGQARWAAVWGEGPRAAGRVAFLATGLPYAEGAWRASEGALEAFGAAWAAEHREACEATRVRGEQSGEALDLRMECLGQRLREAGELVALFGAADVDVVERGAQAAQSLPSPALCARVEELRAPVRPPEGPDARGHVDWLRGGLARVGALEQVGRYAEGLEVARELAPAADAAGHAPLRAEARLVLARFEEHLGRHAEAEADAQLAAEAAIAGRHDEVAGASWTLLALVAGVRLHRAADGDRYARLAEAVVARPGDRLALEAAVLNTQGLLAERAGRLDEAVARLRRAVEVTERAFGPRDLGVAKSRSNLGAALFRTGRVREAVDAGRAADALYRDLLGPDHPTTANNLVGLGTFLSRLSRYEESAAALEEALPVLERSLGPNHSYVAGALMELGNSLQWLDRVDEAVRLHRRALAGFEAAFGPRHASVAVALDNLCTSLADAGRYAEARAACDRAASLAPPHGFLSLHFGDIAEAEGRAGEALGYYLRALAYDEWKGATPHPDAAYAMSAVGRAYLALGQKAKARIELERALALVRENADGPGDAVLLGDTRFALSRLAEGDEARALAEQADLDYRRAGRRGVRRRATLERFFGGGPAARQKIAR